MNDIQTPRVDEAAHRILDSCTTMGVKFGQMADFARQLEQEGSFVAAKVLIWWEDHQYDTCCGGDRNVYDEPPDFVKAAMAYALKK